MSNDKPSNKEPSTAAWANSGPSSLPAIPLAPKPTKHSGTKTFGSFGDTAGDGLVAASGGTKRACTGTDASGTDGSTSPAKRHHSSSPSTSAEWDSAELDSYLQCDLDDDFGFVGGLSASPPPANTSRPTSPLANLQDDSILRALCSSPALESALASASALASPLGLDALVCRLKSDSPSPLAEGLVDAGTASPLAGTASPLAPPLCFQGLTGACNSSLQRDKSPLPDFAPAGNFAAAASPAAGTAGAWRGSPNGVDATGGVDSTKAIEDTEATADGIANVVAKLCHLTGADHRTVMVNVNNIMSQSGGTSEEKTGKRASSSVKFSKEEIDNMEVPFIKKLMEATNEALVTCSVGLDEDGKACGIVKIPRFESGFLDTWASQTSFNSVPSSFRRNARNYGFYKTKVKEGTLVMKHELFRPGFTGGIENTVAKKEKAAAVAVVGEHGQILLNMRGILEKQLHVVTGMLAALGITPPKAKNDEDEM